MSEQTSDKPPVGQANQRKSLRSPLLVLKVKVDDGRKFFFGYAKNISQSGMFIATANPRDPGSLFQVDIPLPEPMKRNVRCTCEVVWQRQFKKRSPHEPGMGLKFTEIAAEDADCIDAWVKSRTE